MYHSGLSFQIFISVDFPHGHIFEEGLGGGAGGGGVVEGVFL